MLGIGFFVHMGGTCYGAIPDESKEDAATVVKGILCPEETFLLVTENAHFIVQVYLAADFCVKLSKSCNVLDDNKQAFAARFGHAMPDMLHLCEEGAFACHLRHALYDHVGSEKQTDVGRIQLKDIFQKCRGQEVMALANKNLIHYVRKHFTDNLKNKRWFWCVMGCVAQSDVDTFWTDLQLKAHDDSRSEQLVDDMNQCLSRKDAAHAAPCIKTWKESKTQKSLLTSVILKMPAGTPMGMSPPLSPSPSRSTVPPSQSSASLVSSCSSGSFAPCGSPSKVFIPQLALPGWQDSQAETFAPRGDWLTSRSH